MTVRNISQQSGKSNGERNKSSSRRQTNNNHALWVNVRKRRIYQITCFSIKTLRELCVRYLLNQPSKFLAVPDPPPTLHELGESSKLELATYLSKVFESCYVISVDPKQSPDIRLLHFNKLKDICKSFDAKFTQTVLNQARLDRKQNKDRASNSNQDTNNTTKKRNQSNSASINISDVRMPMATQNNSENDQIVDLYEDETSNQSTTTSTLWTNTSKQRNAETIPRRTFSEGSSTGSNATNLIDSIDYDPTYSSSNHGTKNIDNSSHNNTFYQKRNDENNTSENSNKNEINSKHDEIFRQRQKTQTDSSTELLHFEPDKDRYNYAVRSRTDKVIAQYDHEHQIIPPWINRTIKKRLTIWEPFWEILHDVLEDPNTGTGNQMAPVELIKGKDIKGSLKVTFRTPTTKSVPPKWGQPRSINEPYQNGDVALLLRMLPDKPPHPDYKADTHTWPKGTFIQLNHVPIPNVKQRRQQIHDESLWKGNSHLLDLTPYCNTISDHQNVLQIASMEHDREHHYVIYLAICRYKDPDTLYRDLTPTISKIPYGTALRQAQEYARHQTVSIDDSSEDEDNTKTPMNAGIRNNDCKELNFSLICPISMKPMKIPVRGKSCTHLQCYDLLSFLQSNSFPSGRRWRCVGCNTLLCLQDLVQCGLFTKAVEERSNILRETGDDRNKLILCGNNGIWRLEVEKKEFMGDVIRGSKRKSGASNDSMSTQQTKSNARKDVIIV